jgi:hypothetical protein
MKQKAMYAALGIDVLTGDVGRIRDRLLRALAELYQTEIQRKEAVALIKKLLDGQSVLQAGASANVTLRAEYEVTVRQAQEYLAGKGKSNIPLASTVSDIQVVSVDLDRGVVILNAGRSLGVKEGTPFLIFRNATRIARVKAFLVYDQVATGMIDTGGQRLDVALGDNARIETDHNSP